MTRDDVFVALLRLTHSWRALPSRSDESLAQARQAIALALLSDQPEVLSHDPALPPPEDLPQATAVAVLAAVDAAVIEAARLGPSIPTRVFLRSLEIPTRHDPASVPAWAVGRARLDTLGPFADDCGFRWWLDRYERSSFIAFARPGAGEPFLLIPIDSAFRSQERLEVAEGAVWIAARALAADGPPGYVGLAVLGGTLTLDGPTHGAGPIVLDPQGSVTLALDLRVPAQTGPGAVEARLPRQVSLRLAPGGADSIETVPLALLLEAGEFHLERAPQAARYEPALGAILVPYGVQPAHLDAVNVAGALCTLSGGAPLLAGGWSLPVTQGSEDTLGEAEGAGALALHVAPGLHAMWERLQGGPIRLREAFIEAGPGLAVLIAPEAVIRRNRMTLELWQESGGGRRSSIDVAFHGAQGLKVLRSSTGGQAILATAGVAAHLDRPLYATGQRPGLRNRQAILRLLRSADGTGVQLLAVAPPSVGFAQGQRTMLSIALANAVLRVTAAEVLLLSGRLDQGALVHAGILALGYGLYGVLPILPAPYAANVDLEPLFADGEPPATLLATVSWRPTLVPQLSFASSPAGARGLLTSLLSQPIGPPVSRHDAQEVGSLRALFDRATGGAAEQLRLFDVSTHADQLGIGIGGGRAGFKAPGRPASFAIRDMHLAAPGTHVRVMMQPQVQWEPVATPPGGPPFPEKLYSADDGGASLLGADSVALVPLAPMPASDAFVAAIDTGATGAALFTLPFGIQAVGMLGNAQVDALHAPANLRYNRPGFGLLQSARQFTLESRGVYGDGKPIPGAAMQLLNATERYGLERFSVLGKGVQSMRNTFNGTFGPSGTVPGVPIGRIDLSGYGESGVSLWADELAGFGPKITKARFDVLVGRTAFEVVQEQALCLPYEAIFVRTITMERRGNARVLRSDTGWKAVTPGVFRLPGLPELGHPGIVRGLYNISNIRETGSVVHPPGAAAYQPVFFDADAAIENVVAGHRAQGVDANGDPVGFVPVRQMAGYVQRLPIGVAPTPAEISALFRQVGPIGGPIDCEVNIGKSGLRMRLTGFHAYAAGFDEFAVSANGMPRFPDSGQWSLCRIDNAVNGAEDNEPQPVDRTAAVPLIRKGKASVPASTNTEPYRFADPADLHAAAPAFDYGILFGTEVFRMMFPRPRIDAGTKAITSAVRPLLADPYALVTTSSVFPKGRECIRFPGLPVIDVLPGGHLRYRPDAFKVQPKRVREQVKTSGWRMALEYADDTGAHPTTVTVMLDSAATPPATLAMAPLNTVVDFGPFTSLIRVVGNLEAKSPAVLAGASVVLGSVMAPVGAIITVLRDLRLPLQLGAALVATDDKSWAWKQSLVIDVIKIIQALMPPPPPIPPGALEKEDSIDLGFCKLRKGEIAIGMFISFCGKLRAGVEFTIEGELQQSILGNLLYAGGYFALQIAFEVKEEDMPGGGKTAKESTKVELAAAASGSVGGELIPHTEILEIEGNVRYGYLLELDVTSAPVKVKPGVIVGLEVEVEVMGGLFAAGLEWEGKALMTRHEDKIEIDAEIVAAVNVTVAWAIEETIEVEGEFKTKLDEKVVAGLLFALGLVPV